ncbi:hypothetical protein DR864_09510 [Runella rosea]|uniref:Protein kinase domain-containing protein n=1 Tax=Runella rosea TaxID=2259595 RepID=A0A344TH33_9BACT|nr:protein kinase family protein [Runella rosea]AXE17954.1 hypothetical protein DR864_09510 [Runella rosea]
MFPSVSEYNQVIQSKGGTSLKTLSNLTFIPSRITPIKIYSYGSGAFAVVFKAKDELDNKYAIRCFTSAENDKIERYREVSSYLRKIDTTWQTEFELLEAEIKVGNRGYPIIKMDWVEGELLNDYIGHKLHDNKALTELQKQLVEVSKSLEKHKVGHGDLQCGNVIVSKNDGGESVVKLIDYDGMYVPPLSGKHSLERGLTEFQHPERSHLDYNEKIDRFSFWVIICAIEALKYDKSLWLEVMQGGFNTLQNTLFIGQDFIDFDNSALVQRLSRLNKPSLSFYLSKLRAFCDSLPENVEQITMFKSPNQEQGNNDFTEPIATQPKTDFIKILSNPSGATIFNSAFQKIGTTPCVLDKDEYTAKTLRLKYEDQYTTVFINKNQSEIWINFQQKNPPIIIKTQQPVPAPQDNEWVKVVIFVIAFTVIVLAIISLGKKQENIVYPPTTDSTLVANDISVAVDTTAILVDTTAILSDAPPNNFAELDTSAVDTAVSSGTLSNNTTAEEISMIFLLALNNADCERAWQVTYNPFWEKKGKAWFCSSQAFGGVNKVEITEVTEVSNDGLKAIVHAKYYASDTYNGAGYYDQYFDLTKLNNKWYIVKIINSN